MLETRSNRKQAYSGRSLVSWEKDKLN